jgi:hypothetical protein
MKQLAPFLMLFPLAACNATAPDEALPDEVNSAAEALCAVTQQELFITDLSVVEDANRTTWVNDPNTDPKAAAWTFGRLMQQMAGANDPSDFTEKLFSSWLKDQTVNSFLVPKRTQMKTLVLDPWPRLGNGKLDLTKAPLRLLAIVNRMDLRKLSQGNAGEGRFVFGVLGPGSLPMQFTVILEYKLPAASKADVLQWANDWHALGSLAFPSAAYNNALQKLTDRFAGAGAAPSQPNGSAISQVRSNEIALAGPWELREFHLNSNGQLVPATVANNPDRGFNNSATLATFINTNAAALIAGTKNIPLSFNGAAFRGGAETNNIDFWNAPGVLDNNARFALSANTCDGCHGRETNTFGFLHVAPRTPGAKSTLSGFLTGINNVSDPVDGTLRSFNDIARRSTDLATLVCPGTQPQVFDSPSERAH